MAPSIHALIHRPCTSAVIGVGILLVTPVNAKVRSPWLANLGGTMNRQSRNGWFSEPSAPRSLGDADWRSARGLSSG